MKSKVSKRIREIIHYDKENPSSRRNYRRAKDKYNKLSSGSKKDFLKLLNEFYNKTEKK